MLSVLRWLQEWKCPNASLMKRGSMKSGGAVSTGAATRLVYVIGVLKWIAVGAIALGATGATALAFAGDFGWGSALSFVFWVYGFVAAVLIYVVMGWLQQTLLMLVGIAKNTAKDDLLSRL